MPKLWSDSLNTHRQAVTNAILDKTAELVRQEGITAITMLRIATETGIGRATLYKYFGDVQAILTAWHARQIDAHMHALKEGAASSRDPVDALEGALTTYAQMISTHHGSDFAVLLHALPHNAKAHQDLQEVVAGLIRKAAASGKAREDVPAEELAAFALAATGAAERAGKARVGRLVATIMDAILKGAFVPHR